MKIVIVEEIFDVDSASPMQKISTLSFMIETPSLPNFIPAVVSTTRGNFIHVNKLYEGKKIRSGIFSHPHSRIDEMIGSIFLSCFELSEKMEYENIFSNPLDAFDHVKKSSGSEYQPHILLIPSTWDEDKLLYWSTDNLTRKEVGDGEINIFPYKFKDFCNIKYCSVHIPVFLSRPDFVGLYYSFTENLNSVVLHNIEFGMAFCKDDG